MNCLSSCVNSVLDLILPSTADAGHKNGTDGFSSHSCILVLFLIVSVLVYLVLSLMFYVSVLSTTKMNAH